MDSRAVVAWRLGVAVEEIDRGHLIEGAVVGAVVVGFEILLVGGALCREGPGEVRTLL